jgi:hypothetical protein
MHGAGAARSLGALAAALLALAALSGSGAVPTVVAPTTTPVYLAVSGELGALGQAVATAAPEPVDISADSYARCLERVSTGFVDAAVVWGPQPGGSEAYLVSLVGADALALVVHPSNQVGPLTRDDLKAIFSGNVRDWWQYGQALGEVQPVGRDPGSGTRLTFDELVMDEAYPSSRTLVAASDDDVLDYVAAHPEAIGYVAASDLREGVRALRVDGERPEPQKVRDGLYSLMAGVWLVARPTAGGDAIWDLVDSDAGKDVLQRYLAGPDALH